MLILLGRSMLAVSFTAGAFLLMSYLITPSEIPPVPGAEETKISITRDKRPEKSTRQQRDLPPPPAVKNTPPPLMAKLTPQNSLDSGGFKILNPIARAGGPIEPTLINNRQAIAMVTIPPEYPQRPLTQNIEGWVLMEFTIGIDGSVENIVVVEAEPKGAFERAAMRAMKRWKYQPKIVDGRPVAQHHMREIFRFELEK